MRILPVVALIFLAACSKGGTTTEIVVRDSAGIQIIEHPAGTIAAAPKWTLGPATLTISGTGGEEGTFTRVTSAAILSDGRVVLVDGMGQTARPVLFSATGTFERALGRSGDGPGEFRFPNVFGVTPGDTILLYDFQATRITRILPDGSGATVQTLGTHGPMAIGAPRGMLRDGRLVSIPFEMPKEGETHDGLYRPVNVVTVIDPSDQSLDTLASDVPGPTSYISTMSFGGQSASFPAQAAYGDAPQVLPFGGQVLLATNATTDVASYAVPWQLTRITRFTRPRTPVDEAARTAYVSAGEAEMRRQSRMAGEMLEMMLQQIRKTQFPDSMSYYSGMRAGTDSTLWLLETASAADSTPSYLLLGTDGRLKATMELPHGARLLWAGSDRVLVTLLDEDDLPRVELRPIVTTPTTP
jgi:hypothetical protein